METDYTAKLRKEGEQGQKGIRTNKKGGDAAQPPRNRGTAGKYSL